MGITDELARERNRAAAERTLMAWIRTCLALISFGFGLDKVISAIRSSALGVRSHTELSVRLMAMAFVLTGVVAMLSATLQHRLVLRRLRQEEFTYRQHTSIAMGTSLALTTIGLVAMVMLLLAAFNA